MAAHLWSVELREKLSKARLALGFKHTEKYKKEFSKKMKGRFCGKKNPFYGKHHTNARKEEQSEKAKGRLRGEKNPNWKGGVSLLKDRIRHSVKYRNWSRAVLKRDNYTCKKCEVRGNICASHHMYNFSEVEQLRFEVSNGITFCRTCHNLFHKIYGRKNNSPIQVMDFILNDE